MVRAVVVALVAVILGWPSPATAEDHRPCVSKREFRSVYNPTDLPTRRELEDRWEVTGLGVRVPTPEDQWLAFNYPACDHPPDKARVQMMTSRNPDKAPGQRRVFVVSWWQER